MLKLRNGLNGSARFDEGAESEINMAPLIDMIFILLIFFLVTASFVNESSIEIDRPEASSASVGEEAGLIVVVDETGNIFIDNRLVDPEAMRGLVELFLVENPGGGVLVRADRNSNTGKLIEVLDGCRLAGAENVQVAARKKEK